MAENIQVASLTAPITVKIPEEKIKKFQNQLEEIADTLEFIVEQMKDVSKEATRSFKGMGKTLKVQNVVQNKFIDGQKQVHENQKKTASNAKRTAKFFGEWTNKLAQVRVALGLVKFAVGGIIKLLAVPAGVFTGFAFGTSKIAEMNAEFIKLAQAVGTDVNFMKAMSAEAKELGFSFEHVNSLIEELNNKMGGEAGGFEETNLREGLAAIGMEVANLEKLKPEEQIAAIMNAGQNLVKKGQLQKVASAFDKIFGQEANRLLTSMSLKMRDLGVNFEGLLGPQKRIVAMSEAAQEGSLAYAKFSKTFKASMGAVFGELTGQLGKRLKPFFKGMEPLFLDLPKIIATRLGPSLDKLAVHFANAFGKGIELFTEFLDNPDKLANMIDKITKALFAMWTVGKFLLDVIIKIAEFLTTPSLKRSALFTFLDRLVPGMSSLLSFSKASNVAKNGLSGLLGVLDEAPDKALKTQKSLQELQNKALLKGGGILGGQLGFLSNAPKILRKASDWIFNRDSRTPSPLGPERSAKEKMLGTTITPNSSTNNINRSNNATTNNVTNNITVNDPETGRAVKEEVFNPGNPQ